MINCLLYNAKSQGNFERSHRSLKQKMYYDLIQQKKTGVNCVKSLPDYMKCLNNEKKDFDIDIVSTKLPSQSKDNNVNARNTKRTKKGKLIKRVCVFLAAEMI